MQLIFDKGLETERSLIVDTINERVIEGNLTASISGPLDQIKSISGVSEFADTHYFTTLDVLSDKESVPIVGTYNYIVAMNLMYQEAPPRYSLNLSMTYKALETKEETT